MKYKSVIVFIFISGALCAMDNQKSSTNQILWFIENIRQNSENNPDYRQAFADLKKSAADQKYKITNKDSLKILRIYELLAQNDDVVPEPIRNIIREQFPETPKK